MKYLGWWWLAVMVAGCAGRGVPVEALRADRSLRQTPRVESVVGWESKSEGVKAIYYEGKPYRGRATKVFAYVGVPAHVAGMRLPAVVLLHGGGGTAFDEWVKIWMDRGYVAIAPDLCGSVPRQKGKTQQWERHDAAGPAGWDEAFGQVNEPMRDQWPYHAVADAMLAVSVLKGMPDVDGERIGLTGISWGGYLTCMVGAADERLKWVVPVYGCGYLDECTWKTTLAKMSAADREKWIAWWDPKGWLPGVKCPVLWVDLPTDWAYPLPALVRSMGLPEGPATYAVIPGLTHGHGPGWQPRVIYAFADSVVKGSAGVPRLTGEKEVGGRAVCQSDVALPGASLWYTVDQGDWSKRNWNEGPAVVDGNKISADLPKEATGWFFFSTINGKIAVSSKPVVRP